MLLPSDMQEELGPPLLTDLLVPACDSKNLSSHFVTMRESAKDKTNMLRVTEREGQAPMVLGDVSELLKQPL